MGAVEERVAVRAGGWRDSADPVDIHPHVTRRRRQARHVDLRAGRGRPNRAAKCQSVVGVARAGKAQGATDGQRGVGAGDIAQGGVVDVPVAIADHRHLAPPSGAQRAGITGDQRPIGHRRRPGVGVAARQDERAVIAGFGQSPGGRAVADSAAKQQILGVAPYGDRPHRPRRRSQRHRTRPEVQALAPVVSKVRVDRHRVVRRVVQHLRELLVERTARHNQRSRSQRRHAVQVHRPRVDHQPAAVGVRPSERQFLRAGLDQRHRTRVVRHRCIDDHPLTTGRDIQGATPSRRGHHSPAAVDLQIIIGSVENAEGLQVILIQFQRVPIARVPQCRDVPRPTQALRATHRVAVRRRRP